MTRRKRPIHAPKLSFTRDVLEWHRGLSFAQLTDVNRWMEKNRPPSDWQGTDVEWAYLSMPVPGGW